MAFISIPLLKPLSRTRRCGPKPCTKPEPVRRPFGYSGAGRFPAWILMVFVSGLMIPAGAGAQYRKGAMSFERNDRLLTWQNNSSGLFPLRPNLKVNYNSELSTSLSMTTGSGVSDRWYDRISNTVSLDYQYSDRLGLKVNMREDWNKDTMSLNGSSFLTADLGCALNYRPFDGLELSSAVDRIRDERFENQDNGNTVSGKIQYAWKPAGELRNLSAQVNVSGGTSNLRRTNDTAQIRGLVAYDHSAVKVIMELTDNRSTRGYFAESVSSTGESERKDVEQRAAYERDMTVRISREGGNSERRATGFDLSMSLGGKKITDSANDKDPNSSKYHTNSHGNLRNVTLGFRRYLGRFLRGEWESGYSRNENNVQRAIRSRTQTDVSTRGGLTFVPTRSDSISMVGWIKRTRVDTPAEVHNDRDELKIESGVKYSRRWAENFNTGLDFRMLETHYVNIDVTQSSQNKWMRTYALGPSFHYMPLPALRIRHEVSLQADYIDFDFDRSAVPRSTINRRVSSETWVTGDLWPDTQIIVGAMFEENEYGKLNTDGSKIPVEDGIRRFLDLSVRYEFARGIIFIPKYVYAIRKDRSVERGTIERKDIDQTYGMDIRLFENKSGDGHDFVIGCKRIMRETIGSSLQIRNYISMTLNYGF